MNTTSYPTQDERVMAALSHVTVLIPTIGVIAPIVIWATQKEKSRFVAFQALQAAAFQLLIVVLWFVGMACYMGSFFLMFGGIALSQSAGRFNPGPGFAVIPFLVIFGMLSIMLLMVIIGIVAAIMVFQGKDFHYPLIGDFVERYTRPSSQNPPASPTV